MRSRFSLAVGVLVALAVLVGASVVSANSKGVVGTDCHVDATGPAGGGWGGGISCAAAHRLSERTCVQVHNAGNGNWYTASAFPPNCQSASTTTGPRGGGVGVSWLGYSGGCGHQYRTETTATVDGGHSTTVDSDSFTPCSGSGSGTTVIGNTTTDTTTTPAPPTAAPPAAAPPAPTPPAATPPAPTTPGTSAAPAALDTTLTFKPRSRVRTRTRSATVHVRFSSPNPGASFQCELDRDGYHPCRSPAAFRVRAGRHHTIAVRAVSGTQHDSTPARVAFRVVRTPHR